MKKLHASYITIILILAGLLILQKECTRCPDPPQAETRTIIVPGDKVPYPVQVDVPVPHYIDTGSWQYRDREVDTMAILKDYFSKVYYIDTLMNDTNAFIAVIDTISENRIKGRGLMFANRKATAVCYQNIISEEKKFKVYAGNMLSTNFTNRMDIGPTLLVVTPKGGYSYAYGVNEKTHTLNIVWKIKLRK